MGGKNWNYGLRYLDTCFNFVNYLFEFGKAFSLQRQLHNEYRPQCRRLFSCHFRYPIPNLHRSKGMNMNLM